MNKIKIGLFGFGVVGQGIFQVLSKSRNAHAEIVKICVRSNKPRSIDASYFTTDPEVILSNPEIDLIAYAGDVERYANQLPDAGHDGLLDDPLLLHRRRLAAARHLFGQ